VKSMLSWLDVLRRILRAVEKAEPPALVTSTDERITEFERDQPTETREVVAASTSDVHFLTLRTILVPGDRHYTRVDAPRDEDRQARYSSISNSVGWS
jgi:hypothetical protein